MAADWTKLGFAVVKAAVGFIPFSGLPNAVGAVEATVDVIRGRGQDDIAAAIGAQIENSSRLNTADPATADAVSEVVSLFHGLDLQRAYVEAALGESEFRAWLTPKARGHRDRYLSERAYAPYDKVLKAATIAYLACLKDAPGYLAELAGENLRVGKDIQARLDAYLKQIEATDRQAARATADRLLDLGGGRSRSSFERRLQADDPVDWGERVQIDFNEQPLQAQRLMYILPAVYVETFVTLDGVVRAITVTARTAEPTPVGLAGMGVTLNETTFATAPLVHNTGDDMRDLIVSVYQRSGALWEVAVGDSVVESFTSRCVGWTSVGAKRGGGYETFLQAMMILAKRPSTELEGLHTCWETWDRYQDELAGSRENLVVNAVAATSNGVSWFPELLDLHLDTVVELDSARDWGED